MSPNEAFKSAHLKITRASKHIEDVREGLREKRPFRLILETDAKAGTRSLMVKRDDVVIGDIAAIAGDAVHNLRSALDHAYAAVVGPVATSRREARAIQFPFSETAARLKEACENRFAHKVGPEFLSAILDMKSHGGEGGNRLLYMVHSLDIPDKHASLVPTADRTVIDASTIRRTVPDYPNNLIGVTFLASGPEAKLIIWNYKKSMLIESWIKSGVPNRDIRVIRKRSGTIRQEIDYPVDITFYSGGDHYPIPIVPTLYQLCKAVRDSVKILGKFCK